MTNRDLRDLNEERKAMLAQTKEVVTGVLSPQGQKAIQAHTGDGQKGATRSVRKLFKMRGQLKTPSTL